MRKLFLIFVVLALISRENILFSQVLLTHEEHSQALIDALRNAQDEVVICSPFIGKNAILSDNLDQLMKEAFLERGVKIIVYTDEAFDYQPNGEMKSYAQEGRNLLIDSFVDLRVIKKVHAKVLIADNNILIIGSYNWLSATRSKISKYRNLEISSQSDEDQASSEIPKIKESFESMPIVRDENRVYCEALKKAFNHWNDFKGFYHKNKRSNSELLFSCIMKHLENETSSSQVIYFLSTKRKMLSRFSIEQRTILYEKFKELVEEPCEVEQSLESLLDKLTAPEAASLESLQLAS